MTSANNGVPCDGWWQEVGFGRQPMHDLRLRFTDGQISGSGYDLVGFFSFHGTMNAAGEVLMLKRYVGAHTVEYIGQYDGEGILSGEWHIGPFKDRWMIKLGSSKSASTAGKAIQEIA